MGDCIDSYMQDYIYNNYHHWNLLSFTGSIRVVASKNLYRITTSAGALTNIFYHHAGDESSNVELYVGFFRCSQQQDGACTWDPDADPNNLSAILETGAYKRLRMKGNAQTFTWFNSSAYKGVYVVSTDTIGTTVINTAFAGGMPLANEVHGYDLMLCNRSRYQQNTGTETPVIRFQLDASCVIACRNKKVNN